MPLSAEQQERYVRNVDVVGMGVEGQERLLASSVLVIGAGGLGLLITEATALFQWGRLATVLIVIVVMVSGFDAISRRIRQALA